jgi:hypothetical protein
MNLLLLPPEILQAILTRTTPGDVARFFRTSHSAYALVHVTLKTDFWRELFLSNFDDPRANPAFSIKGEGDVTWEARVKNRIRMTKDPIADLDELTRVMDEVAPYNPQSLPSSNLTWIIAALHDPTNQLRPPVFSYAALYTRASQISRLNSAPGALSPRQLASYETLSQALRVYAYDPRNITNDTLFGPFKNVEPSHLCKDASQFHGPTVSWIHLEAVTFTIRRALHCGERVDEREGLVWTEVIKRPAELESIRPGSAPDLREYGHGCKDWAGVQGYWVRVTSMLDFTFVVIHRSCVALLMAQNTRDQQGGQNSNQLVV